MRQLDLTMPITLDIMRILSGAAFVLLSGVAFAVWALTRDRSQLFIATAIGLLGAVAILGALGAGDAGAGSGLTNLTLVSLLASGLVLMEMRHHLLPFRAPRVWLVRAGVAITAAFVIAADLPASLEDPYEDPVDQLALLALVVVWSACVLEPAVRFFTASRSRAPVERARLRLLALGFVGIAALVVMTIVAGVLEEHSAAGVLRVMSTGLVPVLYAALAPPARLQRRWIKREAVRERERMLLMLPAIAWTTDEHMRITSAHGAGLAALGTTPNEFVGRTLAEFYASRGAADTDFARLAISMHEQALKGRAVAFDNVLADRVFENHIEPLVGSDGEVAGVVGVAVDSTPRREAEARLHEAQALAHIGSWHWDTSSAAVSWTDEMYRIFGMQPGAGEVTVESWMTHFTSGCRSEVEASLRRCVSSGDPVAATAHIVTPSGDVRTVLLRGARSTDGGGRTVVQGTAQDVTEQRQAERSLRASEERYRRIVDTVHEGICMVDVDGRTTFANARLASMLGMSTGDIVGSELSDLAAPEHRQALSNGLRAGTVSHLDVRFRRGGDGGDVWAIVSASPMPGEAGTPQGALATIIDVTQQKLAQRALELALQREREAAAHLRAVDEMKNAFLTAVSHELRTPLTAILGFAKTLERHDLSEDLHSEIVRRIGAGAEKLEKLLTDLLDLDRLGRGLLEPNRRPTDLAALVRRVVDTTSTRSHMIEVRAAPVICAIDGPKVERIIENLLVNAVKYTPAGSPVTVVARETDGGVMIAVEDRGDGVPAGLQETIFQPFEQAGGHSHSPGVGIGLSLVARFAELHGGRAWVQDRPGGGSSFRVFLACAVGVEGPVHAGAS